MARALGLAVALVLLLVPAASALDGPSGKLIAGSEETALRLHDLPPGYLLGAVGGCAPLGSLGARGEPGGAKRRYLQWVFENLPESCSYLYKRVFEVPGLGPAPPRMETEIVNTPDEEAAAEGFELTSALFVPDSGGGQRTETLLPSGVQVRIFRLRSFRVDGRDDQPGSILLWRHGKLISYLKVTGLSPRGNDRAGLHYAQIQQWRMEHPSPYTEAEQDDSEVWLEDPGLKFPIYWVGNPFEAAGGPRVGLEFASAGNHGPPGRKYEIDYFSEANGFHIGGWTRRGWTRLKRSALGTKVRPARCTRTTEVELEQGRALIYGSYGERDLRPCPRRRPDSYHAIAYVSRMVIGVNLSVCTICPIEFGGPYDSLRGMKAIVRALHLRPKPVY